MSSTLATSLKYIAPAVAGVCLGYGTFWYMKRSTKKQLRVTNTVELDLVNLTPHPLNLYQGDEQTTSIPSAGTLRVSNKNGDYSQTDLKSENVTVGVRPNLEYDTLEGDVEVGKGKDIVVSSLVADYLITNRDKYMGTFNRVLVPDTDPKYVVRGERGNILGVKGLILFGDLSE